MVASLVLNLHKSKDEVLNMSFDDFIDTYTIFYIDSLNQYENMKG